MPRFPRVLQARKQSVDAIERPRVGDAADCRGRNQILADREVRKDLPALGHQAEPRCAIGRRAGRRSPRRRSEPRRAVGSRPMMALTVVDLPMPLRPISVTHSPGARERHAEQRLARAVGRLDAVDGEQRSARHKRPLCSPR